MNKNHSKKLSVIIVCYKSHSVISDCLISINKFNDIGENLEIIIVDNSPDISMKKIVDELIIDIDIGYIHNPANGGFGQGNNTGTKIAKGDLLLFLNPDTILIENIFEFILREFEDETLNIAGFRLVDSNMNDNDSIGILPEFSYLYIPRKLLNYLVITRGLLSKYIYPWGASMVLRKSDFIKAGMFDEKIFLCNEEPDIIHRLNRKKIKIFNKKIIHLEGHTTEIPIHRLTAYLNSTCYYFKKNSMNYKLFLISFLMKTTTMLIFNKILMKNTATAKTINKLLINQLIGR